MTRRRSPKRGAALFLLTGLAASSACSGADVSAVFADGGADSTAGERDTGGRHRSDATDAPGKADARRHRDAPTSHDAVVDSPSPEEAHHDAPLGHDSSVACVESCTASMACAPLPPGGCTVNACTSSCCTTASAAAKTPCSLSGGRLCDGKGACVACLATADCTPSTSTCVTVTCENDACVQKSAAAYTQCSDSGGTLCNGTGKCVECTESMTGACTGNTTHCSSSGQCVQCLTSAQCASPGSATPYCDPTGRCVQCLTDMQCGLLHLGTCVNEACTGW